MTGKNGHTCLFSCLFDKHNRKILVTAKNDVYNMRKNIRILVHILITTCLLACADSQKVFKDTTTNGKSAFSQNGMVVTAHPQATKVGYEILKKGGNSIDAMVGVHFALAVVYPSAGNLGGGGFMMYRENNGEVFSLDFREKASGNAYEDMYLDEDGNVIEGESLYGQKASGVPGSVDGMLTAHQKFGSLPFSELIEPAIKLAKKGFLVTSKQARNYNHYKDAFIEHNRNPGTVQLVKEKEWKEGDLLVQKDLAKTLERIKENGRAGFYEGKTAELLVAEMNAGNGIITLEDLKNYHSTWREPVTGNYRDFKVYSMAPSSSGGIALVQLLKMSEHFPLSEFGSKSAKTIHVMTEMERRVYADRAKHLGDSDFWDVPTDELLDDKYIASRVEQIDLSQATSSEEVRAMDLDNINESEETTHYSIIDMQGNAVSLTTTINSAYGSKVFVEGAGFLMNNEMDDFSSKPGVPNKYGLLGGAANSIQPGKRMLSAMTPTILEKDGKLFMVVGTPGGSTIITSVYQTILNVIDHEMSMTGAVSEKRFHHQWKPDQIYMEEGAIEESVIKELNGMGHKVKRRSSIGKVDAILVRPDGSYEGAADPRGDDWAIGIE
ncbi:gamma-glutamyltransferase [Autumnicola musiva]|uniref:Glutathione hydrolase proenzyme n=1 Tax=Autumnicola musiva TaxID=3075589 RepID=A0ABU3D8V4_9FLAO|nr:gamma-glutamyltransferase [Zunongwangia sp. F117]MDT0677965.1 gamma-glutamyltransferase [Zunongwangia sp. F117]